MGARMRGQGNSAGTLAKEALFGAALAWHMRRVCALGGSYYHLDLNSGCGHNPVANVKGTPFVFLDKAQQYHGTFFRAVFCDKDHRRLNTLRDRVAARSAWATQSSLLKAPRARLEYYHGDNDAAALRLPEWAAHHGDLEAVEGSIISDPNGVHDAKENTAVSMESLAICTARMPRLLLLIHYFAAAAIRVRRCRDKRPDLNMPYPHASDYFGLRRHWLVSDRWGAHRGHVCLVGSTYRIPEWTGHGPQWYRTDSRPGREILQWADADPCTPHDDDDGGGGDAVRI